MDKIVKYAIYGGVAFLILRAGTNLVDRATGIEPNKHTWGDVVEVVNPAAGVLVRGGEWVKNAWDKIRGGF